MNRPDAVNATVLPDRIVIDGSQMNREAIIACDGDRRLRDHDER